MQDMTSTPRHGTVFPGPVGAGASDDRSELEVAGPGAEERTKMRKRTGEVPETVHRAATSAWRQFRDRLSFSKPPVREAQGASRGRLDSDALKSPEEKMIAKIRLRMSQYPEWYETDPDKVAATVAEELRRIGEVLDRQLAAAEEPVEVWQIPLSVFNWLVETAKGETFVHGALKAWSNAEHFNASNAAGLDAAQRAKLRQPFMDLAPMLLRVVLEELLKTGLVVTFAEKFVGPELKFLVMRVQSPVED